MYPIIESSSSLVKYSHALSSERNIAAMCDEVQVTIAHEPSFSARSLRNILTITPSLALLVLSLPQDQVRRLRFTGLQLPRLQTFRSNIPHRFIAKFIFHSPALSALDVQDCRCLLPGQACPLSAQALPVLDDLSCPIRCLRQLQFSPQFTAGGSSPGIQTL